MPSQTDTPTLAPGGTRPVAFVTGAAHGIGRATATLLAATGWDVALLDRNADIIGALATELSTGGAHVIATPCDVSSREQVDRAIDAALAAFGRADALVNNAGITRRADVTTISDEDWDEVMAVNVRSILLTSRRLVPVMAAGGGGSIVNVSSGWGLTGGAQAVVYCASKGAVVNMTRAMAIDHGPANVRVNCVCPGDTQTKMLTNEADQLGQSHADFLADAADRPLGRIGTPEDIARSIAFLLGPNASFITGAVLAVDGGGTA